MTRFTKGLIATAAAVSLATGSATVANADELGQGALASATVGSATVGSAAYSVVYYGVLVAVIVGAYNWAVDQHLIQPLPLPR
ncbi:hypothetical protein [Corynebacterium aquilae]|uniref:Secreted protein n=1 Tax=Corynebacterium aquilae DSM 44791 TaxID=1431546 RepID=A0A1L7CFC9_9CORY|nr:hypothetical protein [Corynebacterium aquilae]APT84536.1 hypothetical protein CAQU_05105 [Corynebacterium aquilae DSM 44791]